MQCACVEIAKKGQGMLAVAGGYGVTLSLAISLVVIVVSRCPPPPHWVV